MFFLVPVGALVLPFAIRLVSAKFPSRPNAADGTPLPVACPPAVLKCGINQRRKNRRDHYLPQSYLRGFIDPSRQNLPRPLWHFDIANNTWSERSPREIGYRFGCYDHAGDPIGVETADETFASLENLFPRVRDQLIADNFQGWGGYRDFLLCYLQMMRARSLLFLAETHKAAENLRGLVIKEVSPDGKSVKVESHTPSPVSAVFARNWTLAQMREEIHKGTGWLQGFNWALRYTDSPADPFIVGDGPVVFSTPRSTLAEGMQDPESLLFFPLCWRACLIGSRQFFEAETGRFPHEDMLKLRGIYRDTTEIFLVAPRKLEHLEGSPHVTN